MSKKFEDLDLETRALWKAIDVNRAGLQKLLVSVSCGSLPAGGALIDAIGKTFQGPEHLRDHFLERVSEAPNE